MPIFRGPQRFIQDKAGYRRLRAFWSVKTALDKTLQDIGRSANNAGMRSRMARKLVPAARRACRNLHSSSDAAGKMRNALSHRAHLFRVVHRRAKPSSKAWLNAQQDAQRGHPAVLIQPLVDL